MSTGHILLVEDDEAARYIFATVLRHAGYQVTAARTATEGLRLFADSPPDAALVDLGLPDFDGLELIRQIRSAPAGQSLPLIVVTVHAFEQDRQEARAAGCDFFLKKPLSPSELLRTLDQLLLERTNLPPVSPPG